MGLFDHLQKNGSKAIQSQPVIVRKQAIKVPASQHEGSVSMLRKAQRPSQASELPMRNTKLSVHQEGIEPSRSRPNKRSRSPQPRFDSSSESDHGTLLTNGFHNKRPRADNRPRVASGRRYRSDVAFSKDEAPQQRVHAVALTSGANAAKYTSAFPAVGEGAALCLQFPSVSEPERYDLVSSKQKGEFAPLEEIEECISLMIDYYLPTEEALVSKDDEKGVLRCLRRAKKKQDREKYELAISHWNDLLVSLRGSERLAQNMDQWTSLELPLIERILTQTYSRTVSPRANELRRYENGTDDVYGELLPRLISDILLKDTKIKADQVFVDLGSGVGNVVLQAALQVGCESWGCEKMRIACDLADLQEEEFKARCRLWGLSHGDIHLERGDFLTNEPIKEALAKADVVLVNNQAFTAALNEDLTNLFLDLKDGCQIVSLKSFVPSDHKITIRNEHSPYNHLEVSKREYFSKCVSWTDEPGTYYVSKKDVSRIQKFLKSRG